MLLALALAGYAGAAVAKRVLKSDSKPHRGVAQAHKMPVQGIDVSQWQGNIDWRKVRKAGIHFAYIKATEGGDHIDPKFHQNWRGAKRAGVPRGAYHFVYWCRPAHEQALWFMLNVPVDPDALPPVLDVEWNAHSKNCPSRIPVRRARAKIRVLLDTMRAHTGKEPIIYTDVTFHKQVLKGHFRRENFWLRSVAAEPRKLYGKRPWLFWQFTTTGRIHGIQGMVDRNVFNGRISDWNQTLHRMRAGRY